MSTEFNAPIPVDEALGHVLQYDDLRVCELGEDGDQLLIEGHPDDQTACRIVQAYGDDVNVDVYPEDWRFRQVWTAFRPHEAGCDGDECGCDQFGWWLDIAPEGANLGNAQGYYAVTVVDL